jgi:hypothetical protein
MLTAALLLLGLSVPVRAQLDPRLQGSPTDFLDLYQQSSQAKVKPEIMAIFDFSGSMASLMWHPVYVNNDTSDGDAYRYMAFTLTTGSSSGGTYTITATSAQDSNAHASVQVTIGTNGSANASSTAHATTFTYGGSTRYFHVTVSNLTVSNSSSSVSGPGTITSGTTYYFSATVTFSVTNRSGTGGTPYALSEYSTSLNTGLTWAVTGPRSSALTPASTVSTTSPSYSSTSWTSSSQQVSWVAPAVGAPTYVTVTLDPTKPSSGAVTGATYLTGTLTSTTLIKPGGAQVTSADADAAKSSSLKLNGYSNGATDVRNWIRAASHVRFATTVGSNTRTIDVPIAWSITNASSTGNPLSSQTVLDLETKVAANGTVTNYGSNTNIEMDKLYTMGNGDSIWQLDNSTTATTATPNFIAYRPAYLSWLFNGKYQNTSASSPYYCPTNSGSYIVYDAATTGLAAGQGPGNLAWGQGYGTFAATDVVTIPQLSLTGTYQSDVSVAASTMTVPALTRCQAVKRAAIQTWVQYQADVVWAFRFLDTVNESGSSSSTTIDNNSNKYFNNAAGTISSLSYGSDSGWTMLNNTAAQGNTAANGNSVNGMQRIAALAPANGTPLSFAMARGLAQFTDPNSVFNAVEATPSQCLDHFLILFTDGIDNNNSGANNPNTTTPYVTTSAPYVFNADTGNQAILKNTGLVNRTGGDWNIFTFAAVAAHMADSSLGNQVAGTDYLAAWDPGLPGAAQKSGTPSALLPFAIKRRNGTLFNHDHRITTMTVGVGLGGTCAPPASGGTSPKWNLFLAAAVGDTTVSSYSDLSQLTPFQWNQQLNSGTGGRVSGSIYFFDGANPDVLAQDLTYAFQSAINASEINVTSNPNLPYIGAALGEEILLGKFQPPSNGGVMWGGDLLMFPTTTDSSGNTVILNKAGSPASTLDSTTAVWSAYNALDNNRRWDARNLYTRLPQAASLSSFTYTGNTTSNPLLTYVAQDFPVSYPAGGASQENLIQMVMGANLLDPSDTVVSKANRSNIMGDIVDSAPAYLEYTFSDITSILPSGLKLVTAGRNRFRIILVGDNQGWLHAFGETSQINSVPNPTGQPNTYENLVTGEVDELWAFMPTDFLKYLDYLNLSTNSHKFMVDGSPTIYFLDLPPATGGSGNGKYDGASVAINPLTDTTHERAIAIIGLREGGRSYYALNLHNPFVPTLQWSLVPDEASSITAARNLTGLPLQTLQTIVANMGFSTCAPSLGRILFNGVYKDVVFLGGGYSVPQVESNFTGSPKLGRSVLAIDVFTGNILAAVDLTSASIGGSTVGPICSGLVPFEYFLGSGMAQRAYFLDMWGSLWCWGSKNTVPNGSTTNPGYQNFRLDTSELQAWSLDGTQSTPYGATGIRKVYHDANSTYSTSSSNLVGPPYTTLPSPFLVGNFPGAGHGSTAVPTAVGIAMVSGNRNDPLDFGTNLPANTRLTVVFDRQDSRAWGFDTASGPDTGINADSLLLNAGKWAANGSDSSTLAYGNAYISQGNPSYYLAPSSASATDFGYYVTFPDKIQDTTNTSIYHYSKGINPPMVVAGSLYYSYFTPTTADVCSGGSGYTYTNKICDVMNPVVYDTRTGITCNSGNVDRWINVASDLAMMGTTSVQQAGTRATANPTNPSQTVTTMATSTYQGLGQNRYPRARVWRTVH